MVLFDQAGFNQFIIANQVIGFSLKPIVLKSGRLSRWYVNWRTVAEDAFLLDRLSDFVIGFVTQKKLNPLCFYGVPEGATKLGVLTQYKWARQSSAFAKGSHALPMGRGKLKEHGAANDKYFVGEPRGSTVILEDVTTTGGSLLSAAQSLRIIGVPILAAITLTDRMEKTDEGLSVLAALKQKKLAYFSMSDALTLLPLAYGALRPGKVIGRAIVEEFRKFGVKQLHV